MAKKRFTDVTARTAKPQAAPYRLPVGDGLYFRIGTTGAKSWELRAQVGGKGGTSSLGKYPAMSLAEAKEAAITARKVVTRGDNYAQH